MHCILFVAVLVSALGICFNTENTYIAAVVDYVHQDAQYPYLLLKANVDQYTELMRAAARQLATIIVFPEYGLVDINTMYDASEVKELAAYSTYIPDPELNTIPCEMDDFSMQLVEISCAARRHNLYTVFNLPEKAPNNETGELEFYNANVVLDRQGAVIARYRKINLSEEPFLQPGKELVTFTTDFNVTFGIFTCFDILFQNPALDILSIPEVTDIIFPTAWYSETPFLQALSIQHGYAKANGINLLAAGLQAPAAQDGGSGIYLAGGTIAEAYIANNNKTKLIIQKVPITNRSASCQSHTTTKKAAQKKTKEFLEFTDIHNFRITRTDMEFSFEALIQGAKKICNEDRSFCCTFNITIDSASISTLDYTYKLAIFKGVSPFGSNILGGIRACAVIACLNNSDTTCGYKTNTSSSTATFTSIHIETIVDKTNDTYSQPATLRDDLTPISEYKYCELDVDNGKQMKITMATTAPQDSLLTFGIYGRMYSADTTVVEPSPLPPIPLNVTFILIIVSFSVVVMICTTGILYKFCMKKD